MYIPDTSAMEHQRLRRARTSIRPHRYLREEPQPLQRSLTQHGNYGNHKHDCILDDQQEHQTPRYRTATCTQSSTKLPPLKTDYDYIDRGDDIKREYGGYISARTPSRTASRTQQNNYNNNNNYYQRLTGRMSEEPQSARRAEDKMPQIQMEGVRNKHYVETGPPIFRAGRAGAPWRHIKQCTGNLGNHIVFVDGGVKENDLRRFPPFGYVSPGDSLPTPRLATAQGNRYDRGNQGNQLSHGNKYSTSYNAKAKQGFKYWSEDKPVAGAPSAPRHTIQGRLMKMGIGY